MINGRIVGRKANGDIIIRPNADCQQEIESMRKKRQMFIRMEADEDTKITRQQQMKIYALINDINQFGRNEPKFLAKMRAKIAFLKSLELPFTIEKLFSLSNCDKELASLFINYLVEYCFDNDIPFDRRELHLTYDVGRMMFLSSVHNRCFATQARREDAVLHIHHVNALGIGGDRANDDHRKRWYMILTAELHDEIHRLGYWRFCDRYHCGAVQLSDEQLISMKLMSRKQMQERDADPDYEIRDWQLPEYKAA